MAAKRTIQWKALLMLITFTVNFCVICHCAAKAAPAGKASPCHGCCGESKHPTQSGSKKHTGDCSGMQAVKFNLLEKQVEGSVGLAELPILFITHLHFTPAVTVLPVANSRRIDHYVPPDLQALYQRFLI